MKLKDVRDRLAELEAEKARYREFIETATAERERLEKAMASGETEREAAAKAVTTEGLESESDSKAILHRLMTQKSHEPGLNQLKDNIAKLSAAIAETERKRRALQAEEARLSKEALALENLSKLEKAGQHFRAMCNSWKDVSADHAETVRLLAELRASGADMPTLLKFAGINAETLFGAVASASYTDRHGAIELILELASKPSIFGNVFYRQDRPAETPGQGHFRKVHAFAGVGFSGRK
jgi:hypothetical protein